ncbi:hypothetical protein CTAYLR_005046 [Chrysophaeum taylorii]|uniref:C3HC-type domain-containing protein n=1 Tax=Chrysophaeum taylorii TaxID=2483200 RepID=A0AAD7U9R8_9STRA|nr:hypothetical protein CTAYLR_005046 [Chrysophaeum taylorii]
MSAATIEAAKAALVGLEAFADEERETRPWSRDASVARLRSYASRPWLDEAEPEQCARFGWRCAGNELVCDECGARTTATDLDAHSEFCLWRGAPLPESVWRDEAPSIEARARRLRPILGDDEAFRYARLGWDAADDATLECSLCARTVKIADDDLDPLTQHRRFCPWRAYKKRILPIAYWEDAPAKRRSAAEIRLAIARDLTYAST